jgi:hypothetical protein
MKNTNERHPLYRKSCAQLMPYGRKHIIQNNLLEMKAENHLKHRKFPIQKTNRKAANPPKKRETIRGEKDPGKITSTPWSTWPWIPEICLALGG